MKFGVLITLVQNNFLLEKLCPKVFPPKSKNLFESFSAEVIFPKLFPTKVFEVNVLNIFFVFCCSVLKTVLKIVYCSVLQ